jgi:hypothetical protein
MVKMPIMELITKVMELITNWIGPLRGVICRFICKSAATIQTRANYMLHIITKYPKEYTSFCWALENGNVKVLDALRKTPFYGELVILLPPKIKRQFEDSIDNREWDKAMDLLRKMASGEWD